MAISTSAKTWFKDTTGIPIEDAYEVFQSRKESKKQKNQKAEKSLKGRGYPLLGKVVDVDKIDSRNIDIIEKL